MSFLQMSFSGAVMIVVIVLIRALAMHRLPKKAFLALWAIVLLRLLLPVSVPSVFSVYSLMGTSAMPVLETVQELPMMQALPVPATQLTTGDTMPLQTGVEASVPAGFIIWATGALACGLLFAIPYMQWYHRFQTSFPVTHPLARVWLKAHPLRRLLAIRQSDQIFSPLTYGILRPVILLPKDTDWQQTDLLQYVLAHEYVHIRRFDTVTKLILILALCVHWFNPLVWVMYLLANRDLELSCDEAVVRLFGEDTRSAYALTLIRMEEQKSSWIPLYQGFSKTAIEERITAIMKTKKTSLLAVAAAVTLIIGLTVGFATSAATDVLKADDLTDTEPGAPAEPNFSAEDYAKLQDLQFEGYENMTVSAFQTRVWELTDTVEYTELLERFWLDDSFYALRDTNQDAGFLCYTLVPLTAERWRTREFAGYAQTKYEYGTQLDQASLEYKFALTVVNADKLTVGEYNAARRGMQEGWNAFFQEKTVLELQNEQAMQKALQAELEARIKRLSNASLQIRVLDNTFIPLAGNPTAEQNPPEQQKTPEPREYPNGTEADYQSLLALKTPNYQKMSVAEFNETLLDWGNADFDRTQRIQEDVVRKDFQVTLSPEERAFVSLTMILSNEENFRLIQSSKTGKPEGDAWYGGVSLNKEIDDGAAWCNLYYQMSYHIADKEQLSVAERDRSVGGVIDGIQKFWDGTSAEELLKMSESDVYKYMNRLASQYSNDLITISFSKDRVQFEHMDERDYM